MAMKGMYDWKFSMEVAVIIILGGFLCRGVGAQSPSQVEVDSLLAIKRGLRNPRALASWNSSGIGACFWFGVKCAVDGQVIQLALPGRGLSGTLVDDIGNLTALRKISIHHNAFTGVLPQTLGSLPALRSLALFMNQFSGSIPSNLGNSSALQALDASYNFLNGEIPPGLAQAPRLYLIDFSHNSLWGGFPYDWSLSQSLSSILLAGNYLSGTLPQQWGNLNTSSPVITFPPTQLQTIDLGDNGFSGGIPATFGAVGNLTSLLLGNNKLGGNIPIELGRLTLLKTIDLSGNGLTGVLPTELAALPSLTFADFSDNLLVGPIPVGLSGTNLSMLRLGYNNLTGSIPGDLGDLTHLMWLDFTSNHLTGLIPAALGNLTSLKVLLLSRNDLSGSIPSELGNLDSLSSLDLSFNNFSGSLPLSLIDLTNLTSLNVSYNNLSGRIPPFPHAFNVSAFAGNPGLCGRPPLLACAAAALTPSPSPVSQQPAPSRRKHRRFSILTIIFIALGSTLGALAVICPCLLLAWRRKGYKKNESTSGVGVVSIRSEKGVDGGLDSEELGGKLVHFDGPMAFSADHLLCATAEVLGKSAYGTVYKATLEDGNIIAVKRLREGIVKGQKEFESDVGTLGKIRHPNLLALRAYYWGPKDEKLLVFDYMSCGSLAAFLHARGPETPLNWETRMNIAMGIARGLVHLHDNENIIHGNLTASNILLDERMNTRISDYGLSRLMTPHALQGLMTSGGTLGYRAPELLKTKKSTAKSDVYSFGIVMLELLTGKAPVEQSSSESGMDLAEWVSSVVKEEWTSEVFDVEIIKNASHHQEEEMMNTLQLALICVNTSPTSRPEMDDVKKQLEVIRPDLRSSPESGNSYTRSC